MRKSCSVLHFGVGFKNTLSLPLRYQFTSLITLLVTEPDRHTFIQCFSSCWVAFLEVWAPVGLGPGTKAERVEKTLGGASGRVTQGTSVEKESGPVLDKHT